MSAAEAPLSVLFCQPTAQRSGSEQSLIQILRALDRDRIRPCVLVGESGPMEDAVRAEGVEVFRVAAPKLKRSVGAALGFASSFPRLGLAMHRLRKAHGLDAVHVNTLMFPQAIAAARFARLPVVTHVREVRTTYPGLVYDAYFRFAALFSKRLIPVCAYILGQKLPLRRLVAAKATVVHNASDLEPVEPRSFSSPARLVAVLPVTVKKGILDLVEALGVLRELRPDLPFQLDVVGPIREPETLRKAEESAHGLGLADRIVFHGESTDVTPHLRAAHVLVQPSHTEAFPRVLVEAMNMALPCVATDAGGSREAVEDGISGYVVPIRAPRELGRRLADVLSDEKSYAAMARAALDRYSSHFTPAIMGRRIEAELLAAAGRERDLERD